MGDDIAKRAARLVGELGTLVGESMNCDGPEVGRELTKHEKRITDEIRDAIAEAVGEAERERDIRIEDAQRRMREMSDAQRTRDRYERAKNDAQIRAEKAERDLKKSRLDHLGEAAKWGRTVFDLKDRAEKAERDVARLREAASLVVQAWECSDGGGGGAEEIAAAIDAIGVAMRGEPAIPDPALGCQLCGEQKFTMFCDTLDGAYDGVPHCEACHIEHDPQYKAATPDAARGEEEGS